MAGEIAETQILPLANKQHAGFLGHAVVAGWVNLGADTTGVWHILVDGSAQGMPPRNATESISMSADGNTLYLTTKKNFNVDAAAGGHSMVYAYDMTTEMFSGPVFSAPANGLPKQVDGLQMFGLP